MSQQVNNQENENNGPVKITEGKATITFPSVNEVFYNPVQEFNRDISVLAIETWIDLVNKEHKEKFIKKNPGKESEYQPKNITLLEALSATGLRSIRYAKEINGLSKIIANDLDSGAVEAIKRNVQDNEVEGKIVPNQDDACDVMYKNRDYLSRYNCIDLDPYGSAVPFLDGAVQSVADGGLLCITCTDLAVLASNTYPETCFAKYGGTPLRAEFCHEAALRLVLNALHVSASRYKRSIKPLLSLSIDFYVRIFVRIDTSPAKVKFHASQTSLIYKCVGCHSYEWQTLGKVTQVEGKQPKFGPIVGPTVPQQCPHCGHGYLIGGPIWNDSIHDQTFVESMLHKLTKEKPEDTFKTYKRMLGMLTVVSEETETPLYFTLPSVSAIVRCSNPPYKVFRSALLNLGYQVSVSHACPASFKTNASFSVVWDVLRHYIKSHPISEKKLGPETPGHAILKKEPELPSVDFTYNKSAEPESRKVKLVRYQVNPTKNWGPKSRHKRVQENDEHDTDEPKLKTACA